MFVFSTLALAVSLAAAVSADHGHGLHARAHHHVGRSNLQKRYSGQATYYAVGLGACGQYSSPNDFIVALNSAQYGGGYPGPHCFQAITICAKGKCVGATIMDECPTCAYGGLDLSEGLFKQFASTDDGVFQMTWTFDSEGGGDSKPTPTSTKKPTPTTTWTPEPTTTWTPEPTTTWAPPTTTSTKKTTTTSPPPETTWTPEPTTSSTSPSTSSTPSSTSTVVSTTSTSASASVAAASTAASTTPVPSASASPTASSTGSGNNSGSGSGSNLADAQQVMAAMGRMVKAYHQ